MIPYFELPPLHVGDIVLHPFGLLVAIGCVAGWVAARREARLKSLDPEVIDNCMFWMLVPGFLTSHVFDLVFYNPAALLERPWSILFFWESMSSFGGFLGGTLGVVGYLAYQRLRPLAYCECLIVGLVVGWLFGRLACVFAHDHPGIHTTFPLAVMYPDGPRHDLGLYEWLLAVVIAAGIFSRRRQHLAQGILIGCILTVYAPARFLFDFLRVNDATYLGLTPAQYGAVVVLMIGSTLLLRALLAPRRAHAITAPDEIAP